MTLLQCPACNSETTPIFLGALGYSMHYRCRDCGAEFSTDTRTPDPPETEEDYRASDPDDHGQEEEPSDDYDGGCDAPFPHEVQPE